MLASMENIDTVFRVNRDAGTVPDLPTLRKLRPCFGHVELVRSSADRRRHMALGALALYYKCERARRTGEQNCEDLEIPYETMLPAGGIVIMKIGCHVLPWGMWADKDTSYTCDGRRWKITLGEAMRQISELKYQGLDCSEGDLEPYFTAPKEFQQMLKR